MSLAGAYALVLAPGSEVVNAWATKKRAPAQADSMVQGIKTPEGVIYEASFLREAPRRA